MRVAQHNGLYLELESFHNRVIRSKSVHVREALCTDVQSSRASRVLVRTLRHVFDALC